MKLKNITLTALIYLLPVTVLAASFECSKAKTKTEILICSDAEVSSLDETLNVAYRNAYNRVENKLGLRHAQRDWLASYPFMTACSNAACLKNEFSERIGILNEVSAKGEPASTWTGSFIRYWNGKQDKDTASIFVLGLRTGRLFIAGKALWYGPNARNGQVHFGDMQGYSGLVAPDGRATFDSDGCSAKLELRGDVLEVKDESGCGGLNVTFNGQYKRK